MKKLRVLFLPTQPAGVSYYRMWMFKEEMNRQGLAEAVMPWFHYKQAGNHDWPYDCDSNPDLYARNGQLNRLLYDPSIGHQVDVVVVQYLASPKALALIEAFKACYKDAVFLCEIDDDIVNTPTWNDAHESYGPNSHFRHVTVEHMKASDGVITTTPHLAQVYEEFNQNISVLPNCLDFKVWDPVKVKPHKNVRIGWMGGASHNEDLRIIEKPLKAFLKKHKNVEFHILNGVPDFFKGESRIYPIHDWYWMNEYPKKVAKLGFDIGLAPLVDCNFNRSKSNLRKLEYAGLRIPVIASNVGEFARTVHHGKDGFLFDSPDSFTQALEVLCFDKKIRQAMGMHNYLDVKKNFNVETKVHDYVRVLQEAHARGQTVPVDVSSRPEKMGVNRWTAGLPGPLAV